ncbi:hypothetical protein ACFLUA_02695 [Chloroflexota bacterium]
MGVAVVVVGANPDSESLAAVVGYTMVVALGGAVTGMLQRPVLRGQVSRSGWWVLASTVGWGLGMAVFEIVQYAEGAFGIELFGWLFGLLFGGAVLGAVTGGALVWLLRQPIPEA